MSPKTKLKSCLDEMSLINQAYSAIASGTKDTREDRKARVSALLKRKAVIKGKLIGLIDEYVRSVDKVKL